MWHRRFYSTSQTIKLGKKKCLQPSSGQIFVVQQNSFRKLQRKIAALWMNQLQLDSSKRFNPTNVLTNQQQACSFTARCPRDTVTVHSQQKKKHTTAMADFWIEREEEHISLFKALPCLDDTTHTNSLSVNSLSTVCLQISVDKESFARFCSRYVLTHPSLREWQGFTWCRNSRSQLGASVWAFCCRLLREKSWVWRPL